MQCTVINTLLNSPSFRQLQDTQNASQYTHTTGLRSLHLNTHTMNQRNSWYISTKANGYMERNEIVTSPVYQPDRHRYQCSHIDNHWPLSEYTNAYYFVSCFYIFHCPQTLTVAAHQEICHHLFLF